MISGTGLEREDKFQEADVTSDFADVTSGPPMPTTPRSAQGFLAA